MPNCTSCDASESAIWHKEGEQILCVQCHSQNKMKTTCPTMGNKKGDLPKDESLQESEESGSNKVKTSEQKNENSENGEKHDLRRRTRRGRILGKSNIPKGKSRRSIFKKIVTKSPTAVATPVTSDYIFFKGVYYQVGDIVSLIDIDGGTYYAQIRGFLQDQYCEKSAVITWLVPTKNSIPPEQGFDPSSYIIGPEEEVPRKLQYMEFVCNAPSDYFKDKYSPFPTTSFKPQACFVWSKLGPQIKSLDKAKEVMSK